MTIDPIISNYIDESIERSLQKSDRRMRVYIDEIKKESQSDMKKEFFNHMTALKEGFQHEVGMLAELVSSKPGREEVREIVREEIRLEIAPLETKITLITDEIIEHRRTLYKHDKRLTKLENVVV